MELYPKIQTVYFRDPETKFKTLLEGQWSIPEFEYLQNNQWHWTEKIDGTNIRVMWDGHVVRFGGRTDNAMLPTHLLKELQDIFTLEKMKIIFPDYTAVCLYGEGYGAKINKGGNYMPDKSGLILFDVKVGEFWLERHNVVDIALRLEIPAVPLIGSGTLLEAIEYVRTGFTSTIAHNKEYIAEGLVMKPVVPLVNRKGELLIAKIKHKDFNRKQI